MMFSLLISASGFGSSGLRSALRFWLIGSASVGVVQLQQSITHLLLVCLQLLNGLHERIEALVHCLINCLGDGVSCLMLFRRAANCSAIDVAVSVSIATPAPR